MSLTILAAEAAHVELPMPSFMYGVVGLAVFAVLAIVTFSFRDVSNRYASRVDARNARAGGNQGHSHE